MTDSSPQTAASDPPPDRGYEPGALNYLKWLFTRFNGRIRLREMWFGHIGLYLVFAIIGGLALVMAGETVPEIDEARESAYQGGNCFFLPVFRRGCQR